MEGDSEKASDVTCQTFGITSVDADCNKCDNINVSHKPTKKCTEFLPSIDGPLNRPNMKALFSDLNDIFP